MKKYLELFVLPMFNISLVALLPVGYTLDIIEIVLKILVLIATLIYTIMKIIKIRK